MQAIRTFEQESAEDVFFGQAVLIWARWFLIAAGATMVLWSFDEKGNLVGGTLPIVALMAMNFYLHGRYLMERPVRREVIVATSLMDLVIISGLVAFWPLEEGQSRLDNQFFLFFYPMVVAFAFVMPRRVEVIYTVAAIAAYTAIIVLAIDLQVRPDHPEYSSSVAVQVNLKVILFRLIAMAALGGLANYYWRIQRQRRRAESRLRQPPERVRMSLLRPSGNGSRPRPTRGRPSPAVRRCLPETSRVACESRAGQRPARPVAGNSKPSSPRREHSRTSFESAGADVFAQQLSQIVDEEFGALEREVTELDHEEKELSVVEQRLAVQEQALSPDSKPCPPAPAPRGPGKNSRKSSAACRSSSPTSVLPSRRQSRGLRGAGQGLRH
jgi:hypothetical protein